MQYGGRNYSCAVIYLTRIKKKLKITDYTKNNIGDARIIKNYEINHKWFESSKGLVVNLEDKILKFLGLNTRDLIMKDADKSFFDEKITFEEAVTKYNVGDKVNVFVVDVKVDKEQVAFSVREYKRKQQRDEISQYMSSSNDGDDGAYTLGDMLKSQKND